jgi:hypothetical protein
MPSILYKHSHSRKQSPSSYQPRGTGGEILIGGDMD